jgi:hypothetical protein
MESGLDIFSCLSQNVLRESKEIKENVRKITNIGTGKERLIINRNREHLSM